MVHLSLTIGQIGALICAGIALIGIVAIIVKYKLRKK
jgi:hypothetical protein